MQKIERIRRPMDINYLYSIVNLYLTKEDDYKKTNLSITKGIDNLIQFNFNMNKNDSETTSFKVISDLVLEEKNLDNFIKMYKQNNMIIDEKYDFDKINNTCYYYIMLNNGRCVSFRNFSLIELNNIRNIIYNIKFQKEEIRIVFEEEKELKKPVSYRLQQAGFTSFKTLIIAIVLFLSIILLSLWIFKSFIN